MKYIILFTLLITFTTLAQPAFSFEPEGKSKASELKIYPNPVKKNKVNISFQSKTFNEIRLINITGTEVMRKKFDFPKNKAQLDLTDQQNGVYLIQIKSEKGERWTKKLLISKN